MIILSLLWIYYMPYLVLCGFFGGLYLIINGIKHRNLLVSILGLLSLSFVVLPFIFWGMGISENKLLDIPTELYWILFSLTGLLAGIIGLQPKIKGIRNMGFIIFTSGIVGDLFYVLMSVPDSMYIN
ncbi:ammonia permease [Bacillus toyonensis]|uniref:ammonia permease n=1 Tax=Bacillus toyonensis TaxID=155322 RepID=UPI0021CEA102|nr:ammonia permease [Bacillus toyonensis]MCU4767366.1 ammonia permease [Bacillus toyonensis]MCU5584405.1 ammonia permease [Bacillus toyonensis]